MKNTGNSTFINQNVLFGKSDNVGWNGSIFSNMQNSKTAACTGKVVKKLKVALRAVIKVLMQNTDTGTEAEGPVFILKC